MGSESLRDLILLLGLESPIYRVDLPHDGSNQVGSPINLQNWQDAILEVSDQFESMVWFGHSFGGMLLQTIPALKKKLKALILANTAPDNKWFTTFSSRSKSNALPNVSLLRKNLISNPSHKNYKAFMLNSAAYYFTEHGLVEGLKMFQHLPFNYKPYLWALESFHPMYESTWVPSCPSLILSSEFDHMTPATSFNRPEYNTKNFTHIMINQAGHFPWIEQPEDVVRALHDFSRQLRS